MSDVLVVGGGVIGLSLAYELASRGAQVRVIDAGRPGAEASWAGAGILPPANAASDDPLERLAAISNELHARWSQELRELTGIDNGYRRTGAIYVARDAAVAAILQRYAAMAHQLSVDARSLTHEELSHLEPDVRPSGQLQAAWLLPDECQIRNPRHLKALTVACQISGVEITAGAAADDFEIRGNRVRGVRTNVGVLAADTFCLTTGAWTAALARRLAIAPQIVPIRGQIVLLSSRQPMPERIINEGGRYLVPRGDGRVLVGSTEEDVGFDRSTTAGAISGLLDFALSLVPGLAAAQVERTWAGLRPASGDGLPYLGRVPQLENAFVAAGHFRSGLQLSPGTALVMSQLIRGERPDVEMDAFRLDRHDAAPAEPRQAKARRQTV
jgi:glycine oxidase